MNTTRRLAAILAADVAGYSAAMERDEEGTAAAVRALRREVIEPKLVEHQGRLIKTTGDGSLVEFASPIAALRCALAIQQRPDESDGLQLRIGLNLGDVIIEEGGDVLGEGVNVAARLESLAEPGGILISGKVYSEVDGKVQATFEDRGEHLVKNIKKPVRAYAVLTAASIGSSVPVTDTRPLPLPDKPSIAVLPFQNMSGDPEQEYFADGIVEDIITALSRFKSLFVIARNSSFTYKGKAVDIKQVGRELGVRYVLEGSVRKAGGRVRITGQLIEAATNDHLWAERFDGALEDVFDLQDQVALRVVGAVASNVERAEEKRSNNKPTENLRAYDCFLRGREVWRLATLQAVEDSIVHFRRAIELDAAYARPYGWMALSLGQRRLWRSDVAEVISEGVQLAERAVVLGQTDAEALWPAANVLANGGRLEFAGQVIDQAIQLNSNLPDAWRVRGLVNIWLGEAEKAIPQLEIARRLCPIGPELFTIYTASGQAYLYAGRPVEALVWLNKALVLNPNWIATLRHCAVALVNIGDIPEARRMVERLRRITPQATISGTRPTLTFRRERDVDFILNSFRAAGMPE